MSREEAMRYLLQRAGELDIEIEVLATETRELNVDSYEGRVSEFKQAVRGGLGLRVIAGGKNGYAWSEELSEEALDWALAEAHENALLQASSDSFLPAGRDLGNTDLLSEGLSAPVEEKTRLAHALEEGLQADPRFSRAQIARYMEREQRQSIASSQGARGGYRSGYAGLMGYFVMKEGDSVKQAMDADAVKEVHDLDPTRTAQKMLERTGRLLNARPLATGRYRAYLEPHVVGMLLRVLEFALSGKTLIEGKSRFEGKLGQRVASDLFTLVDDPDHPGGLGNRPFDSEGTPARRTVLIEDGVLRSFMHNSYTAMRSGQENTGHASRSYEGTLGVSPSNLLLLPGSGVTFDDGVVLTNLMGLHAGANAVSGDISLQALGLRVEGGESYPVENFVISGNLYRMLEQVVAVGEETEWDVRTGVNAPLVEIESLSFGGA